MRMWRQRRAARGRVRVDALADVADGLAVTAPGTAAAIGATARSGEGDRFGGSGCELVYECGGAADG